MPDGGRRCELLDGALHLLVDKLVPRQISFASAAALRREAVGSAGRCGVRACGGPAVCLVSRTRPASLAPGGSGPPCLPRQTAAMFH